MLSWLDHGQKQEPGKSLPGGTRAARQTDPSSDIGMITMVIFQNNFLKIEQLEIRLEVGNLPLAVAAWTYQNARLVLRAPVSFHW